MKTWETALVIVNEVEFDHSLHAFEVYDKKENFLGLITPATIEDMEQIIKDLDNGSCPINEMWEDGNGNVCNMEG
ncbi:hypothetical protein [Halalkalibacter oceani]|uniref:hypothetical protein n=1 Tax=Halalkalibacter oceani TaxID=1653776 RepID=UPI003398AB2E